MKDLTLDLGKVTGSSFRERLKSLHTLAVQEMAKQLGIKTNDIPQLDVLITDSFDDE
jgi:hypothetical protein